MQLSRRVVSFKLRLAIGFDAGVASEALPSPSRWPRVLLLVQFLEQRWEELFAELHSLLVQGQQVFHRHPERFYTTSRDGGWYQSRDLLHNCTFWPASCMAIRAAPAHTRGDTQESGGQQEGAVTVLGAKWGLMRGDVHLWSHCGPRNNRLRLHVCVSGCAEGSYMIAAGKRATCEL